MGRRRCGAPGIAWRMIRLMELNVRVRRRTGALRDAGRDCRRFRMLFEVLAAVSRSGSSGFMLQRPQLRARCLQRLALR